MQLLTGFVPSPAGGQGHGPDQANFQALAHLPALLRGTEQPLQRGEGILGLPTGDQQARGQELHRPLLDGGEGVLQAVQGVQAALGSEEVAAGHMQAALPDQDSGQHDPGPRRGHGLQAGQDHGDLL